MVLEGACAPVRLPSHPAAPKVWPAAEGAWQIRLPLPWALTSVNVFLFAQGEGYLLLDTGIRSEDSLASLEASMRTVGANWDSIREILVSHLHPDHVGAAAEIRRRTGAPVRMPGFEARLVEPLGPGREHFQEAAAFLREHGMPSEQVETLRSQSAGAGATQERLKVDAGLDPGERIPFAGGTLVAIPAPGHSPAQLCFFCPEQRVLFSTDAILPGITPNVGVHWFYQGDPLGDFLRTLDALRELDAGTIAPSHGRPFEGHREWIDTTREHHVRRAEAIVGLLDGEPLDAYQFAGLIWGQDRSLLDRRFGMAEALAHLQHLALEQRVIPLRENGLTRWARP